ncbi:lanthionine synthetase LanC family protein [Pseudonocardia alni]|uniref:lanthionine synthetase LanC family protein n=1 Tax=Pseudonocardia alni TaxID=33907 RepID=UPI0036831B36
MDLDHGDLGVALVLAAADELRPDDGWDHAALPYITRAAEALAGRVGVLGTAAMGLFGGAACVGHTLRALGRSGQRYRNAIEQVDDLLLDLLGAHLHAVPDAGPGTDDYDVIGGLAGVTRFLLQVREPGDQTAAVVAAAVNRLARWAVTTEGFHTPSGRITALEREHQPDLHGGYVNLGYAHGVCGVLAVLALAVRHGVGGSIVDDAAQRIAATIIGSTVERPYGPELPFVVPTSPVTPSGGAGGASRIGWCYGNVGAALALGDYIPVAEDAAGVSAAADRLLATVALTPPSPDDDNPSLCHGVGGLLLVRRHLAEQRAPIGPDSALAPEVLAGRLLGMRDPDLLFGLRNRQRVPLDSPGFLTGSGGAAVALVSWAEGTKITYAEKIITGGSLC